MFSKLLATASLVLALSAQINAHAIVAPPLGVSGTPVRADVQRPSTASPCGNVNVASNIDTSTPIVAAADGTFSATVTDFNAGADGSRSVSATVDPTGQGKTFSGQVTISKNGNAAPTTVGSDQITAALPAGTKCSGGTAGNLCLVAFKTTAGFGNCVVVSQGAATGAAAATNGTTAATGAATNGTAATGAAAAASNGTAAGTAATTAKAGKKAKGNKAAAAKANKAAAAKANKAKAAAKAGTRAPRALLAELEARGEDFVQVAKRGVMNWIWA